MANEAYMDTKILNYEENKETEINKTLMQLESVYVHVYIY